MQAGHTEFISVDFILKFKKKKEKKRRERERKESWHAVYNYFF